MKNTIYLLVLLAVLGGACSKENEVLPGDQVYDVSFAVSAMLSPDELSASTGEGHSSLSLESPVWSDNTILLIYNSRGDLVAEEQVCCDLTAPAMVIGLEKGTYTAVIVGRMTRVDDPEKLSTARSVNDLNSDFYIDKVEFKVDGIEKDVVNLIMKRKTGLLKIDVTDEPSNDVSFVRALVHNVSSDFLFDQFVATGNDHVALFTSGHDPLGGFAGHFLVPGDRKSYKTTVTLEIVGHDWEVMRTVVIRDVTIGANMRTTLRGKLYHSNAQDFTVAVDDLWTGEDVVDF